MKIKSKPVVPRTWKRIAKIAAIGGFAVLAAGIFVTAEITASGGLWRLALSAQLQGEKRCRLDKVISERELSIGGEISREGRIRCLDGREFNFSQAKPHLKFELRECEPARC